MLEHVGDMQTYLNVSICKRALALTLAACREALDAHTGGMLCVLTFPQQLVQAMLGARMHPLFASGNPLPGSPLVPGQLLRRQFGPVARKTSAELLWVQGT